MAPDATRWAALGLACGVALGCQALQSRLEREIFEESLSLTLDRSVDLLPPEGLRVTSTEERAIALAWDPVLIGPVEGYAILRAETPGGSYELIGRTPSRFGTVYLDRGATEERLGDGKSYSYRIHPYDAAGSVSRSHAHVVATTDPRPPPPAGVRAYSNLPRRVVLVWDPSEPRAVAGYTVMRSPTASGPWERVGYADGRLNSVYEDPVPGDLRVMYYRVLAVNRFGGESDPTEPVRAVTKAEPLPPTGLRTARRALGEIELAWLPNVETDLTVYEVWRAVAGPDGWAEEVLIGTVALPQTSFLDPGVGCDQVVRYRIRAVDADALTSDFSRPLQARGLDLGLALERGGNGARALTWDPERARGWPAARVLELRRARPDRLIAEVAGATRAPLEVLGDGERRLAVELTTDADPPRTAPRCEITVQLP